MKRLIISFVLIFVVALFSTGRDRLYIEDFNIAAGETLQVPVILLNDTAYCGLQTDLYLPVGLTLDMEYDEYIIDLTSRKHSTHTVASRLLNDGAIRIYVSSISAREFSGNSGAIMTMSITAASSFSGPATIELKNSICAEAIGTRHVLENEVCHVNSNEIPAIKGDVDEDGKVNINDITALINILLNGGNGSNSADVDESGKVNIDDVTVLINYLLCGKWPEPELLPETFTINGVSFTMLPVEGGTFTMGATPEQGTSDPWTVEYPTHEVTLTTFSIGETEVTQALWQAVMGSNPSSFTGNLSRPVEMVSWDDCQEFIALLNQMTGRAFRLPTEAEWEYAARGGNKTLGYKYAGSDDIDEVAWYDTNSCDGVGPDSPDYGTHPVASKKANELGLYDMSGNVWEWCQDWFGNYSSGAQTNPTGPTTGDNRVYRGGSWINYAKNCRVSCRYHWGMTGANNIGLRLAL